MNRHILVVAEDAAVRATVARILQMAGYAVELTSCSKMARNLIRRSKASAVVLVPNDCSRGGLHLVRELSALVPKFVILVGSAGELSAVRRWVPQADALLYPPDELHLLAALSDDTDAREDVERNGSIIRFSKRTLDLAGRELLDSRGRKVPLTRSEFAALSAFLSNPGRMLSRKYLRRIVSGRTLERDDRSVDVLIGRLRRKIEDEPTRPQLIVTVPGEGYKLAIETEEVAWRQMGTRPTAGSSDASCLPERRQITIVTCQVAGLAKLAAAIDPEDLQTIVNTFQRGFAEIVERFRGTVVQSLGDDMFAFFGYPRAHEEDTENAVRAALDVVRNFPKFETFSAERLAARIGIASGLVVVGDIGVSGVQVPSPIGEAVIRARHLQTAAPSGVILLAENTRDLIGPLFDCRKFSSTAIETSGRSWEWQVVAEASPSKRLGAIRSSGLRDFVGRTEEIERLLQHWSKANTSVGQVVVLTGEAGIGKSRLALELDRRLGAGSRLKLTFSGLPHQVDTPMSALLDEVRSSAGIANEDSAQQRLQKLRQLIELQNIKADELPRLLAVFLDTSSSVDTGTTQLSPQRRKQLIFTALLQRVERLAARHPLLITWEDAQWLDSTSLEFLRLLVERSASLPVLIVVLGRQGFIPPWSDRPHVTTLTMSRLGRADAEALIEHISGDRPQRTDITRRILSLADGVPLFIEELTKSLLRSKSAIGSEDGFGFGLSGPAAIMPETLQALLLERIDHLDDAKVIAQEGAAIGREFSYEILKLISDKSELEISASLDRLVASGLVIRRGQHPQAKYIFKHALVGEAAHSMLHRSRREKLHVRITQALENHFPEIVLQQPELLAHHCIEAGLVAKAVDYLRAAVTQALARSGTTEALAHIDKARRFAALLPESQQRSLLEFEFEVTRGRVLTAAHGYAAPDTRNAYNRARLHCERSSNHSWLPLITLGQWLGAWGGSDHRLALEYAEQLRAWGERNRVSAVQGIAQMALGMTLMLLGQLTESRRHLELALQINQFALPSRQPFPFPDANGRVSALTFLHDCLLLLGQRNQAEPLVGLAEAVMNETEARIPSQYYSRALARNHTLRMHTFRRDVTKVLSTGSELLHLAQEQEYPYFVGTSQVYTGWALAQSGETKRGIERCQDGLSRLRGIEAKCWHAHHCALIAECYMMAGDVGPGIQIVAEALAEVTRTKETVWEAELHRLKGKLLILAGADTVEVENCFLRAITKARQQEAKLLELRAATDFARFRDVDISSIPEIRDHLEEPCGSRVAPAVASDESRDRPL